MTTLQQQSEEILNENEFLNNELDQANELLDELDTKIIDQEQLIIEMGEELQNKAAIVDAAEEANIIKIQ